jgi:hypothetical protein
VSQILRLGGSDNKHKRLSSISDHGSGAGLRTIGASHKKHVAGVLTTAGDGQTYAQGLHSHYVRQSVCHTHVKVPGTYLHGVDFSLNLKSWATKKLCAISAVFGRIMKRTFEFSCKNSLALLPVKKQRVCPATVTKGRNEASHTVDVIVNAQEGLVFDLAHGRISSPGFLSLSCPAFQAEVKTSLLIILFEYAFMDSSSILQ